MADPAEFWKSLILKSYYLCVILFCGHVCSVDVSESELTIKVPPGKTECFFQTTERGEVLEMEYQVLDAVYGEMDIQQELHINFHLISPSGRQIITEFKRSDGVHRHEVKEDGDYQICFDNTYNRFSTKTVYFEIYVDSEKGEDKWDDIALPSDNFFNDTLGKLKETINKVHENLNQIHHYQAQRRGVEARHRNVQEHNFARVNNFSFLFIVVMLTVGAVQVIMVRSLFEEKSKLHKIFKLLSR